MVFKEFLDHGILQQTFFFHLIYNKRILYSDIMEVNYYHGNTDFVLKVMQVDK